MGFRLVVNAVDRSLEVTDTVFDGEHNERSTLTFATEPSGFVPGLREEVFYYEQDATTPRFGGVIFTRSMSGLSPNSDAASFKCDCVDWNYYLDRILVNGGVLTGTITLKAAIAWVVTNFLAGHGFALDPAQDDGPSATVTGFKWERKTANGIFQDLTVWSGGWVRTVSPTKVIRFVQPNLASPSAPFAISAASKRARLAEWTESSDRFATRVEVIWGGTGTRQKTEAFEITPAIVAAGYYETELSAVPTAGVSATINGVPATIGPAGSGAQLAWDWATHRITVGSYAPVLGDDLTVTYTAQYPGTTVVNGSGSPTLALPPVLKDDIVDAPTALAYANGLLAMHNQDVREFTIEVIDEGLKPGQVLSIDLPNRQSAGMTAAITGVKEVPGPGTDWRYTVHAIAGVYQGSPLDFWRGMGGGSPAATVVTVTTTGGTNPSVIAPTPVYLGGSRQAGNFAGANVWAPVVDYLPFTIFASGVYRVRVDLWADNAAVTSTARIETDDAVPAPVSPTSAGVTSATATAVEFDVTLTAGTRYRLAQRVSANNETGYAIGTIRPL